MHKVSFGIFLVENENLLMYNMIERRPSLDWICFIRNCIFFLEMKRKIFYDCILMKMEWAVESVHTSANCSDWMAEIEKNIRAIDIIKCTSAVFYPSLLLSCMYAIACSSFAVCSTVIYVPFDRICVRYGFSGFVAFECYCITSKKVCATYNTLETINSFQIIIFILRLFLIIISFTFCFSLHIVIDVYSARICVYTSFWLKHWSGSIYILRFINIVYFHFHKSIY